MSYVTDDDVEKDPLVDKATRLLLEMEAGEEIINPLIEGKTFSNNRIESFDEESFGRTAESLMELEMVEASADFILKVEVGHLVLFQREKEDPPTIPNAMRVNGFSLPESKDAELQRKVRKQLKRRKRLVNYAGMKSAVKTYLGKPSSILVPFPESAHDDDSTLTW